MSKELETIHKLLLQNRHSDALNRLKRILVQWSDAPPKAVREQSELISAVIKFAEITLLLGRELEQAVIFSEQALKMAGKLDEQRSHIHIQLIRGLLFMVLSRFPESFSELSEGTERAKALGDEDIIYQTSEYFALFFYMQGLHCESLKYAEFALKTIYNQEEKLHKLPPITIAALSAVYLGQFHRAIGMLDFHCHFAKRIPYYSMTSDTHVTKAVLGIVLDLEDKSHIARLYMDKAKKESLETGNLFGLVFSLKGLAYHYFKKGKVEKAVTFAEGIPVLTGGDTFHSIMTPWFLEMYHEFERQGYGEKIKWRFESVYNAAMESPNIHTRGVCLRLRALDLLSEGENIESILAYLSESESCLKTSGDPVQLAKTRIEMARLKLRQGKRDAGRFLAMKARRGIAGYSEDLFPDELQKLLGNHHLQKSPDQTDEQLGRIFTLFEEMGPSVTGRFPEIMLSATNRFFKAEHSALFRFDPKQKEPELLAVQNITKTDISSKAFRHSMFLIQQTFREDRPIINRGNRFSAETGSHLSVLCLPFNTDNQTLGVIYHDNVYLKDGFNIDEGVLRRLSHLISAYLRQNRRYQREFMEKESLLKRSFYQQSSDKDFLFPTPGLKKIGALGGKVADSDAPILIYGETGTGKEVMANWIHEQSSRNDNPFVVLEPTAIPISLMESELFGHEKGAFTGADRQKIGRIELAHNGTLFIDEIGEMSESTQIKLLRVLQEKRFTRVGGGRLIHSNFRLLAATNRDLIEEIKKGRFREDLYYRLNVVEITIPPLRERKEDIPVLARRFLNSYGRKYNRPNLALSKDDETRLKQFDWPGNVRELRNVIERAVLLSADSLELDAPFILGVTCRKNTQEDWPSLEEMQRRYIRAVLDKTEGKISGPGGAIEILGMKRTTFNARLKKLGLR